MGKHSKASFQRLGGKVKITCLTIPIQSPGVSPPQPMPLLYSSSLLLVHVRHTTRRTFWQPKCDPSQSTPISSRAITGTSSLNMDFFLRVLGSVFLKQALLESGTLDIRSLSPALEETDIGGYNQVSGTYNWHSAPQSPGMESSWSFRSQLSSLYLSQTMGLPKWPWRTRMYNPVAYFLGVTFNNSGPHQEKVKSILPEITHSHYSTRCMVPDHPEQRF